MNKKIIAIIAPVAAVAAVSGGAWLWQHERQARAPKLSYVAQGYGGVAPAGAPAPKAAPRSEKPHSAAAALTAATEAYNSGNWLSAEKAARQALARTAGASNTTGKRQAAEARLVLAYSAARRKDLTLARTRFAELRQAAAQLPDRGTQTAKPGEALPTLEEEAVYQQAVCASGLGKKAAAETELRSFIARYPRSPLAAPAAARIARMHGGDLPASAKAVWQTAMAKANKQAAREAREAALCGPECLAELLRRRGSTTSPDRLADEMNTGVTGTTMAALARAARKRGFTAQGVALTQQGLLKQQFPMIALVQPGHYVVVDKVTPSTVQVWDPDARGKDKPGSRTYALEQWASLWSGYGVTLRAQG